MKLEITIKSNTLKPTTKMIVFKFLHILTICSSALLLINAVSLF